jgi:hypothetical protein
MCRATWKSEPLLKYLSIEDKLDAEAVQGYIDWLYSASLRVAPEISRRSDLFNLALLKCWAVASAVDDECFKRVVISTFFKDARAGFSSDSINWAFVEGHANEEIEGFVIEVFMAFIKPGWFGGRGDIWPENFVRVLADKALEGMVRRKGYTEVRRKWLRGAKEGVEEGVEEAEEEKLTRLDNGGTENDESWDTLESKDVEVGDEEKDLPKRKRRRQSRLSSDWGSGANAWKW